VAGTIEERNTRRTLMRDMVPKSMRRSVEEQGNEDDGAMGTIMRGAFQTRQVPGSERKGVALMASRQKCM
jgi:hypothetical protein